MKNNVINPNNGTKPGYVAYPDDNKPVAYLKVSGDLKDKFSFISDQIFDLGDFLFVPEDLYNEVMLNGHS